MTNSIIQQHGLSEEEYQKILSCLGREPSFTELGIFSVMWSEHCSYKSSRMHLKRLPTEGARVLQGPGENAGAIDIGNGLAAVFKIESHNHPSFIEPFQGAATGVGGILRDIFTMGARPIALLDSLRFGELDVPQNQHLVQGVVAGISWYGNCIGVPTIGGELAFNDIYSKNPLVNVLCLGIADQKKIAKGLARGVGNLIVYIGAKTGRDGIHGATMASDSFEETSEAKRPNVQVGDPFLEKLLLEACMEFIEKDLLVGIQDMGAAGLTSSSCEMAARAGTGLALETDSIPCREPDMTPYEILLSESQDRMLLVVQPEKREEVTRVCRQWGIEAAVIGTVTNTPNIQVRKQGHLVADIPVSALTDDAPRYERPAAPPPYQELLQSCQIENFPDVQHPGDVLQTLLSSPSIAHKGWVFQQYDHMVGTNTVVTPGSDAAIIRIKGTGKALALTTDGDSRYCLLNPYMGGMLAVAEAARNLVCAGAEPIGVTDCLNFGNPERPDIMWQFVMAVEGIGDACRALNLPVVSGNVSFYNETNNLSIYPTPIIGMVGLLESEEYASTQWFKNEGDEIILLGETNEDLGGSEYLKYVHHREQGTPPWLNLEKEKALHQCLLALRKDGWIQSAHDCSEGGLAVTLAECCVSLSTKPLGATIRLHRGGLRLDSLLFGESPSRVVLSVGTDHAEEVLHLARQSAVPAVVIGRVGGPSLNISLASDAQKDVPCLNVPLEKLVDSWMYSLRRHLTKEQTRSQTELIDRP